jgi:hypothetical protein
LLEFALFDQASRADQVLMIQTRFFSEPSELGWSLLLVPSADALDRLSASLKS